MCKDDGTGKVLAFLEQYFSIKMMWQQTNFKKLMAVGKQHNETHQTLLKREAVQGVNWNMVGGGELVQSTLHTYGIITVKSPHKATTD
jgi:hypothetical protein